MSVDEWTAANQRHLVAALELVRCALKRHARPTDAVADGADDRLHHALADAADAMPAPSALDAVVAAFGLSPFERDILLLCAGMELSSAFPALCAAAQGDARRAWPSFGLALAALPGAHWSALLPGAPLRRFRLVELGRDDGLTRCPLQIDEWVLHALTGVGGIDERLRVTATPLAPTRPLSPSHRRIADYIAALPAGPVVWLADGDPVTLRAIAAAASAACNAPLYCMRAAQLPASAIETDLLDILWERESRLTSARLLLELGDDDSPDCLRAARAFAARISAPLMISSRDPLHLDDRACVRVDVRRPSRAEQHALWRALVDSDGGRASTEIDRVVAQFDLGFDTILAVHADLRARIRVADVEHSLWDACRTQARPRLEHLAERIEPAAAWDDLVVPAQLRASLREIVSHVRHRACVHGTWGFAGKSGRGLGISALFAGPSGTGKTMAAEVLASELRLDLFRIDLSQVVNKYIGETEKNLRRVFDAAESGAAILLFDEADALFGKRSEVKDSHDRHANIEVSYLLQRMENYHGLAILTTNARESLDQAFLRRLRFVLEFPFPGPDERREIWARVFPSATPTEGLDYVTLGRLNLSGGNIRNIAMQAAFMAADEGNPVRMHHLARAARDEYAKIERGFTDFEFRGLQ